MRRCCTSEAGVRIFFLDLSTGPRREEQLWFCASKVMHAGEYSDPQGTPFTEKIRSSDVCAGMERATQLGKESQWGLIYLLEL